MEDKQRILDLLLPTLQATRNLEDLISLTYDQEMENIEVQFPGGRKYVNVAGDSGTAMILDVINRIV